MFSIPPKKPRTLQVAFRLSLDDVRCLNEMAKQTGGTRAQLVRYAIQLLHSQEYTGETK